MKLPKKTRENLLILGLAGAALLYFNLTAGRKTDTSKQFRVITSTTPAMVEEMAYAVKHHQFAAITGWGPHWMNAKLPLKYLKDPQKVFGETEGIYTVARRGFAADYPNITKFLRQFKWCAKDLDELSLICYESNGDYAQGVRQWLEKRPELAARFLAGTSPQPGAKIKLINSGNHNELATNMLLKILLEENLQCQVECASTTVPLAFAALAEKMQDLMVTVWLPNCHKNEFARIRDQVEMVGCNLPDAYSGIAVPAYAPVETIADLKKYRKEFAGKIISIEPGQGILQLAETAIDVYGLNAQ